MLDAACARATHARFAARHATIARPTAAAILTAAVVLTAAAGLTAPGVTAAAVGTTARTFVDPARSGRSVACDVYYPAPTAGQNVPVAEGAFPILSFGHGYLIGAERYAYLGNGLASAGFIVVLAESEGGLFPDHGAFGLDLAFVLRALADESETPGALFEGHVAPESAVLGHSMGGGASFLAADSDPDIDAIANLAAAETNPSAIAAASRLTMPALLLAGELDCVTPPEDHQVPMYEALTSDCRTLVTIRQASHCQFAESGSLCELGEFSCDDPGLGRAEQQAVVLQLLVPWLRAQLTGDMGAWDEFQIRIAESDVIAVQDCALADLEEFLSTHDAVPALRILPNPARGSRFTIAFAPGSAAPASSPLSLRLVDARGRTLESRSWTPSSAPLQWDLGSRDLASGIYWIVASNGSATLGRGRLQVVK